MSDFFLYIKNFWGFFAVSTLLGGLFGIDVLADRYSKAASLWLDKMSKALRYSLEAAIFMAGMFYAGYLAWDQEYKLRLEAEKASKREQTYVSIAQIYKEIPKAGNPKTDVVTASRAYVEVHDHAIVLWIEPLNHVIRLGTGGKTATSRDFEDRIPTTAALYFDDKEVVKLPGLPHEKGCLPPRGGIVKLWQENPADWQAIGCRQWYCNLRENSVRYQVFENGYVISGMPLSPDDDLSETFFIQSDTSLKHNVGVWHSVGSLEKVGICPRAN